MWDKNLSPDRCWGGIFVVSVEGDIIFILVYIWGLRNSKLNIYALRPATNYNDQDYDQVYNK